MCCDSTQQSYLKLNDHKLLVFLIDIVYQFLMFFVQLQNGNVIILVKRNIIES